MTILPILTFPNPVLLSSAVDVKIFDETLEKISIDLTETMLKNNLVGLASVQVGILQNLIVVDFGNDETHSPVVLVNPKIKYLPEFGKSWKYEGCGSIPNVVYNVERVNKIRVTANNIHGNEVGLELSGDMARRVLHEENHNRGILINKIGRDRKIIGKQ